MWSFPHERHRRRRTIQVSLSPFSRITKRYRASRVARHPPQTGHGSVSWLSTVETFVSSLKTVVYFVMIIMVLGRPVSVLSLRERSRNGASTFHLVPDFARHPMYLISFDISSEQFPLLHDCPCEQSGASFRAQKQSRVTPPTICMVIKEST